MVDVTDLGTNVSAERFVDTAIVEGAQVIAVSAMMVHTATGENGSLADPRSFAGKTAGNKIKLAVGGAPYRFDPELYARVGADAWAPDGVTAAKVIVQLIRE